jgi:hypothetical protein
VTRHWRASIGSTLLLLACTLLASLTADAQYVSPYVTIQGTLSTSSGTPASNATLTLSPSQVFFVAGQTTVVMEAQCGTDVNGQVVGVGNPVSAPRVSVQVTGALPVGNYYVEFAWYDQFGIQTLVSPEVAAQLTHAGELQILPPIGSGPPQAVGMAVYIGTAPGAETLQGTTASLTAQFTQAAPLAMGTAAPIRNLTACRVVANDAGFPTGTGYTASLVDASGNNLFNYSEMWQFFGPGSTYNLSQGIPYYHGQVTYPIPILTIPFNHNPQSISGPLSLSGYNLYNVGAIGVGTSTPAWGIDVEGTGLNGVINAKGGYLVNGLAGTVGQCLTVGSDGYLDTFATCIGSLPTLYYQGVLWPGATTGSLLDQEPYLAIGEGLTAASFAPLGGDLGRTVIDVNGTQSNWTTDPFVVGSAGPGTTGNCPVWDAVGGLGPGGPCGTAGFTSGNNSNGYWVKDPLGHIHQWGHVTGETSNTCFLITFPVAFVTAASIVPSSTDDFGSGATVQHSVALNSASCPSGPTTTGMYDRPSSFGGGGSIGTWWIADGY